MPTDPTTPKKGTVGEIAENVGSAFRHMLPGVLIFAAARVTHPTWFTHFNSHSWSYLAVVGVIAIAVGNAWFIVNRYVIDQLVDYVSWLLKSQGPARGKSDGYLDHLAKWVKEAVVEVRVSELARQHVAFRASSVLLMYTLSGLFFLAALWSEKKAITFDHEIPLLVGSIILFVAAVWQNVIVRRIDAAVLHKDIL